MCDGRTVYSDSSRTHDAELAAMADSKIVLRDGRVTDNQLTLRQAQGDPSTAAQGERSRTPSREPRSGLLA